MRAVRFAAATSGSIAISRMALFGLTFRRRGSAAAYPSYWSGPIAHDA
jgi:hypothetical protein